MLNLAGQVYDFETRNKCRNECSTRILSNMRLIVMLIILQIASSDLKVVITGSTGVLGRAIAKLSFSHGLHVFAGHRNELKVKDLHKNIFFSESTGRFSPIYMDVKDIVENDVLTTLSGASGIIVFNNAGVCHKGCSIEILKETLLVNSLAPIRLSQLYMLHGLASELDRVTVINVSSGDGELALLHSDIQRDLNKLTTMEQWENCVFQYMNDYRGDDFEYAFGETPIYSLSKAFLNVGTKILWKSFPRHYRLLAVCPGNFQSSMTMDNDSDDVLTPDEAARYLLETALDSNSTFNGNDFIRKGKLIPW